MHDIGKYLKEYRVANDLSVIDMAERLGIGRQWVYQIEGGARVPSPELTEKILRVIGIRVVLLPVRRRIRK